MQIRFLAFLFFSFLASGTQAQIISTFAGTGTFGTSPDGGLAASSDIAFPRKPVCDPAGNIYFLEPGTARIRMVNTAGILSTFAGMSGQGGYSGDGGPALSARIFSPESMIRDNAGNFYFTDQNGDVIRKIDPAGIITTITGHLPLGYSGDGGPLNMARFNKITCIAFDNSGNLFIADAQNHAIRKVNAAGIITTVAGTGVAGFSGDGGPATAATLFKPIGIAIDASDNLYIGDVGNLRVRKVNTGGIITTFAGNGTVGYPGDGVPATSAAVVEPLDLAVDIAQNIYFVERNNSVIRKVNTAGIISTYAGNGSLGYTGDGGPPRAAAIGEPYCVYFDNNNNLYISCDRAHVIRKVTSCLATVISQTPDMLICNNNNGAFSVDAGNVLLYQWQVNTGTGWNDLLDNGTYSGTGTNVLNLSGVTFVMHGYQYRCKLNNSCGDIFTATSTLSVSDPAPAALMISTPSNAVCQGAAAVFTAVAGNGGTNPVFQWMKNNINTGNNSSTYIDNNLVSGDVITCSLTSNSNCVSTNTALSNPITISIKQRPSGFLPPDSTLCTYSGITITAKPGYLNYLWNTNFNGPTLLIKQAGLYWLEVTDQNQCTGRDSITIQPKTCLKGLFMPNTFTPNNDSKNDLLKPKIYGSIKQFEWSVFNRYGETVFYSKDINRSWDGKFKGALQHTGVYTWVCTYQTDQQMVTVEKGTVLLLR